MKEKNGIKGHAPLWALLPALTNREAAKGYLANAEKILGRPPTRREVAYLQDVIEQGDRVEAWLRKLGYYDPGPRGELLAALGVQALGALLILTAADPMALKATYKEVMKSLKPAG